jgi:putative oxidoreductase
MERFPAPSMAAKPGGVFPGKIYSNPRRVFMKLAGAVSRYFLGLMFLVFGLNDFLNFIPAQMPPGKAGEFAGLLMSSHYVWAVGAIMVISAILFLINRYVALALVLLGPVLFNILLFHIFFMPATIGMGIFATLLWLLVFWQHRAAFAGIFAAKLGE